MRRIAPGQHSSRKKQRLSRPPCRDVSARQPVEIDAPSRLRLIAHRKVGPEGEVGAPPRIGPAEIGAELSRLEPKITADAAALMATSSLLDRLRGTGPLSGERAREHGALGPIGKASGFTDDDRLGRPYDAYPSLGVLPGRAHSAGDALARLRVRWEEVEEAFRLLRLAAALLAERPAEPLQIRCDPADGRATGWAEAPQGEVLYDLTVAGGRVARCHPRSASFHNLVLMHEVFAGDILTDFPFIEASFGLSVAGVAL